MIQFRKRDHKVHVVTTLRGNGHTTLHLDGLNFFQ